MIRRMFAKMACAGLAMLVMGRMGVGSKDVRRDGFPAEPKKYEIGVIAKSNSNPVFLAAKTGAMAATKDLEKKYDIKVTINWRTPNSENAQEQAQYVEQLVSQG